MSPVNKVNKVKVSATVSPDRLRQAKQLTGCENVSEVIEQGLAALIARELERIHADGYAGASQGAEVVDIVDSAVWSEVPWDEH
jgi:uncharacterized protein YgbK (DUF1537 family)